MTGRKVFEGFELVDGEFVRNAMIRMLEYCGIPVGYIYPFDDVKIYSSSKYKPQDYDQLSFLRYLKVKCTVLLNILINIVFLLRFC